MLMMAKMGAASFARRAGGAGGFPVATITSVNLYGGIYGYAAAGGYLDTNASITGGALSSSLLAGETTSDVLDNASVLGVYFVGDVMSSLSGVTAIKVDGTDYAVTALDLDGAYTVIQAEPGGYVLGAGSHTIQLI